MRINRLILQDFKFFYGFNELQFSGNNALVYGENGSGKSSIYWALYTFMQSSIKEDDEVKKYFDPSNPQNLVNRYTEDPESKIILELVDDGGRLKTLEISAERVNTNDDEDTTIKEANFASDFINYRILSRVYDFRNSEDIDLFEVFEHEILDYIRLDTIENAGAEWQYLKKGLDPRPNMTHPDYRAFQERIRIFNNEFKRYLENLIQDTNRFLQENFHIPIHLTWSYQPATYDAFIPGSITKKRNHKTLPPRIFLKAEFDDERVSNRDIQKPHTFLNEAKLTAIALSLRLSVLTRRLSTVSLKILVLDDLLISLDMSNREIVLDIILQEFSDMQMIILTHDKLFYEYAKNKIRQCKQQSWLYYEMYEDTRDIPRPFIKNSKSYLQNAEYYLIRHDYDVAGNYLRKASEEFCKNLLPKKLWFNEDGSLKDLNRLLLASIKFLEEMGFDTALLERLDGHRKFVLNSSSHDSYDVPKFKREVEDCLNLLIELNKIDSKPFLKHGEALEFSCNDISSNEWKVVLTLQDDFRVVKFPDSGAKISKGMINYKLYQNGVVQPDQRNEIRHTSTTLEKFYKGFYEKSDQRGPANFLEGIHTNDGRTLLTLLTSTGA